MSTDYAYVHLQGLLRGPITPESLSVKEALLAQGIHLKLFDIRAGKPHKECTLGTALGEVDKFYQKEKKPLRMIGRSMGGFISALYASMHPECVDRLVLLNPAFHLERNWINILEFFFSDTTGKETMRKWEEEGEINFQTDIIDGIIPIQYEYLKDSVTYPSFPLVEVPIRIYYGKYDILVSPETHYQWREKQKHPELVEVIEVDDNHLLGQESSLSIINDGIIEFFK